MPDIVIERGHNITAGRGAEGCRGERDVSVLEIFPEREWQHQDIFVPSAEFSRYLASKQPRVAPRNDDLETIAIVKRAKHAVPAGKILNLIEEKKRRVSPRELVECREKFIHIEFGKSTQAIIFEIYKQDVLFRISPPLHQ
ncbi:hypothetical protein ES708_32663 [subsurface metagenome]